MRTKDYRGHVVECARNAAYLPVTATRTVRTSSCFSGEASTNDLKTPSPLRLLSHKGERPRSTMTFTGKTKQL